MQYHLKVATLNFSGINVSPFEYHDGSEQKSILDRTFRTFLDRYNKDNPKTTDDIAKLDKIFQKERYTILYQSDCGCVRGKLLTKQQFQIVWDRTFDLNQAIVSHMNLSNQSINRLRSFDFMIYEAYLSALFGEVNMNQLEQYNSSRYIQQLKKWHSKSYLNQNLKVNYVKQYILKQQLDILFLQQALTDRGRQYLPSDNYSFVKNAESMIIYKKEGYLLQDYKDSADFDQKYKDILNFNKDSCYYKCKDIFLISVHLTSKKSNVQQAKQMFAILQQIQRENPGLKIVIGADANHKLKSHKNFKIFPEIDIATTRKKRTALQCQFQKANKLVQQSKDFIITNIDISSSRVQTIRSWDTNYDLLPNDDHPFDHFVVSANLEFDKPKFRSRASSFLKHFANPIKILIQQSTKQEHSKSFQQTNEDIVARIVPPQGVQSRIGTQRAVLMPTQTLSNSIHHNFLSPRPINTINFDQQYLLKWQLYNKRSVVGHFYR